ncbi:MAG: substrate-binding domain-containing protein [Planctomycetes bacterium]|nr:substrate-binding domain-containing protein [Planctomycetota bacterium]
MRYGTMVFVVSLLVMAGLCDAGERVRLKEPHLIPGKVKTQPTKLDRPEELFFELEKYPRTSGSTSAEPLGVWVACRLLNRECRWPQRGHGMERRLRPLKADYKQSDPIHKRYDNRLYGRIVHYGTHGSYTRLIEGQTDLIYECRLPSEDERKLMRKKDMELVYTPIALDAFVFLCHQSNSVTGLTAGQVRDIYTKRKDNRGKIKNWKEVGGSDHPIHAYVRNRNSGSQETMKTLVMKNRKIVGGRSMIGHGMTGPYNLLHSDKAGIGFTFFYYQRYMSPFPRDRQIRSSQKQQKVATEPKPVVRMLAINGVKPSRESIANRTYPWVTEVYVVTRKGLKQNHAAVKLRQWFLTGEGQRFIGETGYVPISSAKK